MPTELPKAYEPKSVESDIYDQWIARGAFNAEPDTDGDTFCVVIPPPNVTAALHLGHALNNTLQDILVRYRRMTGRNTLWMPGTDHAGIATQTVVEKRLLAEEGRKRTDFQRDEFVARVQQWKDEYEATILEQLHRMGCSCDWRRTRFTMDDVCAKAVRETFFRLFADGLIYRGKRLVNWDPATQTVLADDEVEHETVQGHFWYLRYPLTEPVEVDGETLTHVTVATTRPETMLGDTAVAMNPRDPRAAALAGKTVRLPLVGREIPIITDEHVVLPDADSDDEKAKRSTGFLKVTPAHDPNDWEIGFRQDPPLPVINIMAPDGTVSDRHGWDDAAGTDAEQFLGMDRFEAREAIVEWFRTEDLLEKVEDYSHEVGHSYRSHVPIEPYLSDQWYVAVKKPIDGFADNAGATGLGETNVPANSLAGLALGPLLDQRLRFVPERYARNYQSWLENLRDWPISRQLWWGHQIPIWTLPADTPAATANTARETLESLARERSDDLFLRRFETDVAGPDGEDGPGEILCACVRRDDADLQQQLEDIGLVRDPDVLDTWFSSALWPFSTLGWPEDTPELRTYYPGNVLCTAREIITLWVSRMVMMGQYCAGDIPFSDVFIHAMIQDGQGRKMSKSLGNGIDPFVVIDSHGADAMRFTLCSMTTQTQDVRMPVGTMTLPDGREVQTSPKFDIGRNFCNKLWNASRFAMMNLEDVPGFEAVDPSAHAADVWLLSRLHTTIRDCTRAIEAYRYNDLADTIYHFVWDEFCDWYLEIAKSRISAGEAAPKALVAFAMDTILRLLHPVAPFITEAIWAKLNETCPRRGPDGHTPAKMLVNARWPDAEESAIDPAAEQTFDRLADIVRAIRNVRTEHNVKPSDKVNVLFQADGADAELLQANADLLRDLAGLGKIDIRAGELAPPARAAAVSVAGWTGYVRDIIDPAAERARLAKQKETLEKGIRGIEGKLGNENFVSRAPAEVVQRERDRLEGLQKELTAVDTALAALPAE